LIFRRPGAKRNYFKGLAMTKSKKTKKAVGTSVLTPDEQRSLDALLRDLSRLDPTRLAEQIPGPHIAEALAEKLPAADPRTPAILLGLRSLFHEKSLAKAIKRAAFRLKQKGIALPEEQDSGPPVLTTDRQPQSAISAYLGPIDGMGSRPVFISIPQVPAGVDVAIGVVNDQEGIIEFALTRHSRKRMKEIKGVFFSHLHNMVETTLSHAADVLERAYGAKDPGVSDSARAYLQFRPWLREHTSRIDRPLIYQFLAPETISSDLLTESQLQRLFGHELMASWIMDLKSLTPLIEEIRKAEESRIFISEGQRREHIQRIKHGGTTMLFPEARRQILKYRLEEMAYILHKSSEENLARLCLAAALSLSETESSIRSNPFLEFLIERSLAYRLKNTEQFETPPGRQSQRLIIT
jgi:hypothetical protein